MNQVIVSLDKELKSNIDENYRIGSQNFFKESVKILGVRCPIVRKISKKYFSDIKHLPKKDIFCLCEQLLKIGHLEYSTVAFDWASRLSRFFSESDFVVFESWLKKYISNWASCDDFCSHILGVFLFMFPLYLDNLNKWAKSDNMWLRRASAVSLIYPVRKGKYFDKVLQISIILLEDKEDLVQKGYGWTLKEAGNLFEKDVFEFVMKNKKNMPRTALRYAIEKMSVSLKKKAMA